MRKIWLIILLLNTALTGAQKLTCPQIQAIIEEQVKASRYAEAHETWLNRGKCHLTSEEAFTAIEKTLLYLIEQTTAEEKTKIINQLIRFYDEVEQDRPNQIQVLLIKKAMLLQKHRAGNNDVIFNFLDRAYQFNKGTFLEPKAIQLYFSLYVERFKLKKYQLSENQLFALFDDLSASIRTALSLSNDAQIRNYQSVQNGMRVAMASVVSCPKLIGYYAVNFKSNADNVVWLENATLSLSGNRCTLDTLFAKVAEQWYRLSPSENSAYQAAVAALRANQTNQAIERFDAAASYETKPDQKAKIYHTIGSSLAASNKELAYQYAKKALEAYPSYGKAYLLMAQIIQGATACVKTPFETKVLSLLAAQIALKAGEVEPELKATATRQAELFQKKGPSPEEIKAEKMEGKSVYFACFINQSVQIPK